MLRNRLEHVLKKITIYTTSQIKPLKHIKHYSSVPSM